MKKNLLVIAGLLLLSLGSFSQSNLVIFAEDGDAFYAYVNGVKQNTNPETNVKVTGLSANVALRVEFANAVLPQLKQAMAVEPGFEYAIRIKRNAKELKLRFFGQTPISNDATPGVTTVPYHSADNTGNTYNTTTNSTTQTDVSNGGMSVTSSTTSTSVNNGLPGNGGISINMSGTGVNMNVQGMNPNGMNSTTSTTITNSSSSSSSYSDTNNNSAPVNNASYNNTSTAINTGCGSAMGRVDFDKMKQTVESKSFSDTKMSTAKIATKNGCLSSAQIKEMCRLFNMDDDKLAYAKYAYDYCVDKANFYRISEVFSFSATTDDLNKFLESK